VPTEFADLAIRLFGDRLQLVERYVQWLLGAGVERGLIGPRETDRLWSRHILNCVAITPLIPAGATVVDIGSGAGLPGLAIAFARPDLDVVLVESMLRRTTFLDDVVADLELERVTVRRARAEELRGAGIGAEIVTARALAPIDRLVRWAAPLLAPGGTVLAIKGASAGDEVTNAWPAIVRSGFDTAELLAIRPSRLERDLPAGTEYVASTGALPLGAALNGGDSGDAAPGAARADALTVVAETRWSGDEAVSTYMPSNSQAEDSEHWLARVVALHRRPQGSARRSAVD
jgi:16S rRNA (guanine527-N7)-methyltransferase